MRFSSGKSILLIYYVGRLILFVVKRQVATISFKCTCTLSIILGPPIHQFIGKDKSLDKSDEFDEIVVSFTTPYLSGHCNFR